MANDDSETGVSSLPKIVRIDDRNELLAKARAFLQTPSILAQDVAGRREFLKEKGLLDEEIASLLSELVRNLCYLSPAYNKNLQPPSIPPRTYPRPIPSRLPVILNAALKLLGILSGSSIVLLAIYFASHKHNGFRTANRLIYLSFRITFFQSLQLHLEPEHLY